MQLRSFSVIAQHVVIYTASKASERGRFHLASPVEGAT
jgi:hypothetical protein